MKKVMGTKAVVSCRSGSKLWWSNLYRLSWAIQA